MNRLIYLILCVLLFTNCEKEAAEDLMYLNLTVLGDDEPIRWETIETAYAGSDFKMTASGYDQKKCILDLVIPNQLASISVSNTSQFIYSNGILFVPDFADGEINITERSSNQIRGTFQVLLRSTTTNEEIAVVGDFGYRGSR